MEPIEDLPDTGPIRGSFYARDYLRTNIRTGVTRNRAGTRLLCLSSDFLLGLRKALTLECGPAAETVYQTCGRTWGRALAERFAKEWSAFYGMPVSEMSLAMFEACLVEAFNRHGWGRLDLDFSQHERGLIEAALTGAVMAELVGKSDTPADPLMAGALAGIFSCYAGQDLDCVQTECQARGAPRSRFVLGLRDRLLPAAALVLAGKPHDEIVAAL